jgi:hypothetical protein
VTTTRVGASRKYADGWETAFGGKKRPSKKKSASAGTPKRAPAKKAKAKKKAAKGKKKAAKKRSR